MRVCKARVCLTLLLTACAAYSQEIPGIPRFHQVNSHLYRGAQPSNARLQALASMGIAMVLDLRPGNEKSTQEQKVVESLGMHYLSIPMPGLKTPTPEMISQALKVLQDASKWPIFVHCQFGVDRTGTVIACYRMQAESWPNEKAQEEAQELGMHKFERGMKKFILNFQPDHSLPPAAQASQ